SGKTILPEDVLAFARIVLDRAPDAEVPEIASFETAVRAAGARHLGRETSTIDERNYGKFDQLAASFNFAPYAMPFNVAASVVCALGRFKGEAVVVTDPAGALVAAMPRDASLRIVANRPSDRARASSVAVVRGIPLREEGVVDGSHLCAVSAPAGRKLETRETRHGFEIDREDVLAMFDTLERRSPFGRSVHVMEPGIADTIRDYIEHIGANFRIDGRLAVDPGVWSGTPGGDPYHILVVGPRYGVGDEPSPIPELDTADVADDVFDWAKRMAAKAPDFGVENASEDLAIPAEIRESNQFQTPYVPASRAGSTDAMIPRNHDVFVRRSLSKLVRRVGDVDQYVADALGFEKARLFEVLGSDQIDAVALALEASKKNRGFLLADETGRGKGRQIAARLWASIRKGQPAIFLTNKVNLLADIARDLKAIGVIDRINPMVINADFDLGSSDAPFEPTPRSELRKIFASGDLPNGVNLVLGTYSQFNTLSTPRAAWLKSVARKCLIVADESHEAAGMSSNIGKNISVALEVCPEIMQTSATHLRSLRNLEAYGRILPSSIRSSLRDFMSTLKGGGDALQETVLSMLVEDGVYIRREKDQSRKEFKIVIDEKRLPRNTAYVDALAPIMSAMAYLAGEADKVIAAFRKEDRATFQDAAEDLAEEGQRVEKNRELKPYSAAFGSNLWKVSRLFTTALMIEQVVEMAIADLRADPTNARKPVIGLETTMEALLAEMGQSFVNMMPEEVAGVPRDFRQVLLRALDNIIGIDPATVVDIADAIRDGKVPEGIVVDEAVFLDIARDFEEFRQSQSAVPDDGKKRKWKGVTIAGLTPEIKNAYETIKRLIMAYPPLPLSPFDELHRQFDAAGIPNDEITGRQLKLAANGEIVSNEPRPVVDVAADFNRGDIDVLVLGKPGSNGISLHSSPEFVDRRPRTFYEMETSPDVAARVQFWGRVDRRGQVNEPRIVFPSTGLPFQIRQQAMHNKKLASLSANITSNRDHAALSDEIPDIINEVGEEIAYEYLIDHPDLAERLAINMEVAEETIEVRQQLFFHVNRLFDRLLFLSVAEQNQVIDDIFETYKRHIEDLDLRGINPLRPKIMRGEAKFTSRVVYEGVERPFYDSAFDQPVYATEIEREIFIKPMRSDRILEEIEKSMHRMGAETPAAISEWIRANMVRILTPFLSDGEKAEDVVARKTGLSNARKIFERLDKIASICAKIQPGSTVSMNYPSSVGYRTCDALVLDVKIPPKDQIHILNKWRFTVVRPGVESPISPTISFFFGDNNFMKFENGQASFAIKPGIHGE
ncbi:MAG: strawberry notch family protein, partial [Azospirillum sp.]|nr:strawberry notch family protein [Azospirillum sp.]